MFIGNKQRPEIWRCLKRVILKSRSLKLLAAPLILFIALSGTGVAADSGKIRVFVSILPQKTFLERIGGPRLDVSVMVRPGASPATYEPRPRQMVGLAETRAYFSIGVPFEEVWLEKITATNPEMRLFRTEEGIVKMPMKAHHPRAKRYSQKPGKIEPEKEQNHGIMDPHIWTSPPLVKTLAQNILRGLVTIDSENMALYEEGYQRFIAEIDAIDAELKEIFAGKRGAAFMVFHPSWGYFARTYGLEQVPVEIEGKEPKPARLQGLIKYAREKGIKMVFVQPEFSAKSAKIIGRAIGGEVVFVSPLAPDWKDNLKKVAAKFKAALR